MDIVDWLDAEGTPEAHEARDLIEQLRTEIEQLRNSRKPDGFIRCESSPTPRCEFIKARPGLAITDSMKPVWFEPY